MVTSRRRGHEKSTVGIVSLWVCFDPDEYIVGLCGMVMASFEGLFHFGHRHRGQVLGKQQEQKEKETERTDHDAELDHGGCVETPGMGCKPVGNPADDNHEPFPPHAEIYDKGNDEEPDNGGADFFKQKEQWN